MLWGRFVLLSAYGECIDQAVWYAGLSPVVLGLCLLDNEMLLNIYTTYVKGSRSEQGCTSNIRQTKTALQNGRSYCT